MVEDELYCQFVVEVHQNAKCSRRLYPLIGRLVSRDRSTPSDFMLTTTLVS